MAIDYRTYITSAEWKIRSRLYRNAHPKCEICGCGDKFNLHTHHVSYDHLGDEPDEDLMTLCKDCHEMVERIKNYDATQPVLHYYKDTFCYEDGIKRALGRYAPICDKIYERATSVYPPFRLEYEHRSYCRQRISEFKDDVIEKGECVSISWAVDVKKLKEPEIDVEKEFGIDVDALEMVIAPELGRVNLSRIIGGLKGIDDRITYTKDSGDCLECYAPLANAENGSDYEWIFYSAYAVVAYLLEIIDCYKYQYPNLVHNAKVIAVVMAGKSIITR